MEGRHRGLVMNRFLTIVCVHGVGLWPGLFNDLDFGWTAVSVTRPGYGRVPVVGDLADHVDFLAEVAARHAPVAIIGVSGGATLALACASQGAAKR